MILLWFILDKHWFINDSVNKLDDDEDIAKEISIISWMFFSSFVGLNLFTWKKKEGEKEK